MTALVGLIGEKRVLAQFKNDQGDLVGKPFDLPLTIDERSLLLLCNAVLKNVRTYAGLLILGDEYHAHVAHSQSSP